jgi:hypothetical protein
MGTNWGSGQPRAWDQYLIFDTAHFGASWFRYELGFEPWFLVRLKSFDFDTERAGMFKEILMEKSIRTCMTRKILAGAATVISIAGMALPAWGALGGDFGSVQADQVHMLGTLRSTTMASYTVHEIQSSSGTVVREYVASSGTAAGKVFAIGWKGPWPPDMRQVLGGYFDQYVQAAKAHNAAHLGRRPLVIEEPGLVMHAGGHPRGFVGRAYVPGMLPAGLSAEDVQ